MIVKRRRGTGGIALQYVVARDLLRLKHRARLKMRRQMDRPQLSLQLGDRSGLPAHGVGSDRA